MKREKHQGCSTLCQGHCFSQCGEFLSLTEPPFQEMCAGAGAGGCEHSHIIHIHNTHTPTPSHLIPSLPHIHSYVLMYQVSSPIRIHRNYTFTFQPYTIQLAYTFTYKLYFHSSYTFPCTCTYKVLREHPIILHCTFTLIPPRLFISSPRYTPHKYSHTTYPYFFSLLSQNMRRSNCPQMTVRARVVSGKPDFSKPGLVGERWLRR